MKSIYCVILAFLLTTAGARAQSLSISSLSGPVTSGEINSFITYMQAQSPPPTPWGPLTGTGHNDWADGYGGRDLEAMGEMFEVSSNLTILNLMISWADYCTSQRNDLMAATNGGQRVMWTGLIDKVWVPNWPTDGTDGQSNYCGCESEDTIGHLAFCAKLILESPGIWNTTVPDGNPYGYGVTYFQRATNYLGKCDDANSEYFLKWFIQPGTSLIVPPTNSAWIALNENVTANNRQMMFTSGFQRLAECHQMLGDNPSLAAQYNAIVQATINQDRTGMVNFHPYTTNGVPVYDWGYYPTTDAPEATEIHAEYDIIGLWRAFNNTNYGCTLAPLIPFANTMVQVIYEGGYKFAGDVSGGSGTQSPIYSGWLFPADWNPQVYTTVAGSAYTNGWYSGSPDIDAGILFMKNRRYLEFAVTPSVNSTVLSRGAATNLTVWLAPLGGFTNAVTLSVSGLPAGTTGSFNYSTVGLTNLNYFETNLTLTISNSSTAALGAYPLNIIGTSGGVAHTSVVNLVVGSVGLSAAPASQIVVAGNGTSYVVTVTTNSGFSGSVNFGITGLPAGATAGFSPASLNSAGTATLTINTATATPAGSYTLTISGTNGAVVPSATVTLTVVAATPLWNGGSAADNNWSDATNWSGVALTPADALIFSGTARLNNTNDTAGGTGYSNITFAAGSGAFTLNGNPIFLNGDITNNSSSIETINLGLNFSNNVTLVGAAGTLVIAGGLTNTAGNPGVTTVTLDGIGELSDLWKSTSNPGGTNVIAINDGAASWTVIHNAAATGVSVPWVFSINNGTLNYGTGSSAPDLNLNPPDNIPQDNLVGNLSGATATFNMQSGTLTTASRFDTALATDSTGIVNLTGGTMNIGVQFQGANGQNPGEVSIVTVSGGTMNIGGGTGPLYVASRDTGTLTISGGTVSCGKLDISRNAYGDTVASAGTVNLDGGTLSVQSVTNVSVNQETGGTPTAAFNFNGGTLLAKSGASAGFFQGSQVAPVTPIITTVQAGGAVIDDGGNAITILEPLQHDGTLGTSPDGGLTKLDTGTLTLTAANTYNGPTTVQAGTLALAGSGSISNSAVITVNAGAVLDASVRTGGSLTLAPGQMLTGDGGVKGNVYVAGGAVLAPGGSLSTLAFGNNLVISNGSTTIIETSLSPATNDVARVTGTVTYGGTLFVTNISGNAYTAGVSFKIFNAAAYAGAFTNITPPIPDLNLAWNTSQINSGILAVVSAPSPRPVISGFTIQGGNLVLASTNGVANWPCELLATTNLSLPLGQWTVLSSNQFNANGTLDFTNALLGGAQGFYRLELMP